MTWPAACTAATGTLEVDGVNLHTAAWWLVSCVPLWPPVGAARRYDSVLVPGATGTVPEPFYEGERRESLPFWICGEYAPDGELQDPWPGLEANLNALDAILAPVSTGDGTRSATLTMPSGTPLTADVVILGIAPGATVVGTNGDGVSGVGMLATLELVIPAGRFA